MTVIDDLKRLERAGDEQSKANQKLAESASSIACKIADYAGGNLWPIGTSIKLPRDYTLSSVMERDVDEECEEDDPCVATVLSKGKSMFWVNAGGWRSGHCVRIFAQDIATGLLGEVAECLKELADKDLRQAGILENIIDPIPE